MFISVYKKVPLSGTVKKRAILIGSRLGEGKESWKKKKRILFVFFRNVSHKTNSFKSDRVGFKSGHAGSFGTVPGPFTERSLDRR